MKELATVSIGTEGSCVELNAELSLVVLWEMLLFHQLILSMSKGTTILELALPGEFPVSAHLCLELHLVALHELLPLLVTIELFLRPLNRGQLESL